MNEIEIWADVWCPFAHIGLRRIAAERDRRGDATRLRVRAWPLELVNGAPLDPAFIAEEVDEIRPQLPVDAFVGFRQDRFPSTSIPALALTEAAYDVDAVTGERVALALRDALFERGIDVSDPAVLAAIATEHGVGEVTDAHRAAVHDSWQEGIARGVIGSPHVFTADGHWFCPALRIQRVDGHLRVEFTAEMFDQFLAACFPT
jgi:predicted DsbA family dithiol-disulfide isomerase